MNQFAIAVVINSSVTARGEVRHSTTLTLMTESGAVDGAFYPAQNVQVYGVDGITKLRNLCDELIKQDEEYKKALNKPV